MRVDLRKISIATAVVAVIVCGSVGASMPETVRAGWQPLVEWLGGGSPKKTIDGLKNAGVLLDALMRDVEPDAYTEEFAETVRKSLYSFRLDRYYTDLPEATGDWHWLALTGTVADDKYLVGKATRGGMFGAPLAVSGAVLGDMSTVLRAMPITTDASKDNYLLQAYAGMVIGDLRWDDAMQALQTSLRWIEQADQDPVFQTLPLTGSAVADIAILDERMARVFTMLSEAYPNADAQAARMVELIHMQSRAISDTSCYYVEGSGRLRPDTLEDDYAAIAKFFDKLGNLIRFNLEWKDQAGDTLIHADVDSDTLSAQFEFAVCDGHYAGFTRTLDGIRIAQPKNADRQITSLWINARIAILGLSIDTEHIETIFTLNETPLRADIAITTTTLPEIRFSGRALGIIPTGIINLFIPGNMQQLAYDFAAVAVNGNQGRGVAFDFSYGKPTNEALATAEMEIGFEALNNFLVEFSARIAMKRFVPDDSAREDLLRFLSDLRHAFNKDLQQFSAFYVTPATTASGVKK